MTVTQTKHNYFNFTFSSRPCSSPTSFSSRALSVSSSFLSTADPVSMLVFFITSFYTWRQLQQVVNTSDQSVQERRIPYKLHDHISHQKTGIFHCVFGIWRIQKWAEGLLLAPQGKQLDDRDLPCCEYESELQFCTCFLCSQGSIALVIVMFKADWTLVSLMSLPKMNK